MSAKIYRVKVLDFKYQPDFEHLNFRYLTYEVAAEHEKDAIKIARTRYMNGQKELSSEELPFLLKLFSASQYESHNVTLIDPSLTLCSATQNA